MEGWTKKKKKHGLISEIYILWCNISKDLKYFFQQLYYQATCAELIYIPRATYELSSEHLTLYLVQMNGYE